MKAVQSAAAAGVALILGLSQARSQETPFATPVRVDIKSQPLAYALSAWAQQTGLQLIIGEREASANAESPRVVGRLTPRAALEQILAGSSLSYQLVDHRTVVVQSAKPDNLSNRSMVDRQGSTAPRREPPNGAPENSAQPDEPPKRRESKLSDSELSRAGIEEITVTGTRLRTQDATPSMVSFTREQIEQTGATSIANVLDNLPQQSFSVPEGNTFAGSRTIQLRGLGRGTTLVLINGRRAVTSALQGGRNQFDLNSIPLSAVERIDVLPQSASAVYGADAVAGVVNVILKSHLDQPTVDLYYGAADGGAEERRASMSWGFTSARSSLGILIDLHERDELPGDARERYADADFRRFGGIDRRSTLTNPGNVISRTSENLPGLPSRFAAIPAGSTGIGLTPESFLATAGQQNRDSSRRSTSVLPEMNALAGHAFGELEINDAINVFGELMHSRRDGALHAGAATLNATVPASNPYNPFGVPVTINYRFTGIGSQVQAYDTNFTRLVTGVAGRTSSLDWELSVLGTRDDGKSGTDNVVDTARVNAALAAADPAQALNVFQDGPGGSPELLRSLLRDPLDDEYSSRAVQAAALIRGRIFNTWAGSVEGVLGAENRAEELHYAARASSVVISPDPDRRTTAVYGEAQIPLIAAREGAPSMPVLSLTVAARHDHYNDFGDSFNPQYGVRWQLSSAIQLHASYGTSFRPPALFELHQPQTEASAVTNDPRRNNESVSYMLARGGNPSLEPEKSDSLTAGIVISPPAFESFLAGATYWEIEQSQRMQTLSAVEILHNEHLFPDRIVRDIPTPEEAASGIPGKLLRIDITRVNFGELRTRGMDFHVEHRFQTRFGDFTPRLRATWVWNYEASDSPSGPPTERVGIAHTDGTVPRWRAVASLNWVRREWAASTHVRYTDKYRDTTVNVVNGRIVPSQTLVDTQVSLDLDKSIARSHPWLQGIVLRVGVMNLFDEAPHYSDVLTVGFDPSQADTRQRFAYLSLRKAF